MSAWLADVHDPVLSSVAAAVTEDQFGPDLYLLVRGMLTLMYQNNGIGLAAPQVGTGKRLIVWDVGVDGPAIAVNPVVERVSLETSVHVEGCLSLPGIWRNVERPRTCEVRYESVTGEARARKAAGLLARVLLHEIDHLDGVLMTAYPDSRLMPGSDHSAPL